MKILSALIALAALATGCGNDGRVAPPDASVIVVHAAPGYRDLLFNREIRFESSLTYRGVSDLEFDVDTYDFSVEYQNIGMQSPQAIAEFEATLTPQNELLIVLAQTGGLVEPLLMDIPVAIDNALDTRYTVVHAAPNLDAVDVYIEEPGTDITTSTPFDTLAFREGAVPATRRFGDYEITLTEAGVPANVILRSPAVSFGANRITRIVIVDGAQTNAADVQLIVRDLSSTVLGDRDLTTQVRIINLTADQAPRDVYVNQDFTSALLTGLPYGEFSEFTPLPAQDENTLQITPAGMPGVTETAAPLPGTSTIQYTIALAGTPGSVGIVAFADERRSYVGQSRVRYINGVNNYDTVGYLLLLPGTDPTPFTPLSIGSAPSVRTDGVYPPGDYELTVYGTDTDTIVADAVPVTFADGGVYTIAFQDNDDGVSVDVEFVEVLE